MSLKKKNYFTLIELLIVVAIILILISLTQPALRSMIIKAQVAVCINNQSQLYFWGIAHADDHQGRLLYYPSGPWSGYIMQNMNPFVAGTSVNESYTSWGKAYSEGYLPSAEVFYCPLNPMFSYEQYQTPQGEWGTPIGKVDNFFGGRLVRAGYVMNPFHYKKLNGLPTIQNNHLINNPDNSILIIDNLHYPAARDDLGFPHELNMDINITLKDGSTANYSTDSYFEEYLSYGPDYKGPHDSVMSQTAWFAPWVEKVMSGQ